MIRWLTTILTLIFGLAACEQGAREQSDETLSSRAAGSELLSPDSVAQGPDSQLDATSSDPGPGSAGRSSQAVYSSIEDGLVQDNMLGPRGQALLESEDFQEHFTQFARQNATEPDAQERTRVYGEAVASSLSAVEGSEEMTDFACGQSVCMGYTQSEPEATWFSDWYNDFARFGEVPRGVMLFEEVPLENGRVEHRFLLTTQEGGAAIRRP